jgi:hypothetical protein
MLVCVVHEVLTARKSMLINADCDGLKGDLASNVGRLESRLRQIRSGTGTRAAIHDYLSRIAGRVVPSSSR